MPFIDSSKLEVKEPRPGWKGRFFHSEQMTFAYYTVAARSTIQEHRHPNDEVWHVIDGEIEITIDGTSLVLGPGMAAVVPPNTRHSAKARKRSRAIVVDHPVRRVVGGVRIG